MTAKLDASAVIYLSKADLLGVIARVYSEVVITTGVYDEVVVRGREAGHPDAMMIEKAVKDRLVRVISLDDAGHKRLQEARFPDRLGHGEQETIIEALEQGCLAVLDDHRARSAAVVLGASPCRTGTVLVEALVRGIVGLADYESSLLRLAQVKGIRPDDLAELLRLGRLVAEELSHGSTDD